MGALTRKIIEKERPIPRYEVPLRRVEEVKKPPENSSLKSISPDEFEDYIKFAIDELEKFGDKPYVMFENKKVWFDAKTSGIFPRFEAVRLPSFVTLNRPLYNYPGWTFEGFIFQPMTSEECSKSFVNGSDNPYLNEDGNFNNFPTEFKKIILVANWKKNKSCCVTSTGSIYYYSDTDEITMVPIHRLNGVNAFVRMRHAKMISSWLENELIPDCSELNI